MLVSTLFFCGLALAAGNTPLAVPNAAQLRYQDTDFVALIHFNMGTYAHNGDPSCDATNWNVVPDYADGMSSDAATFNPVKLNTSQWMESIQNLGSSIAILTAKHGCGFAIWPTEATLPDGSPYDYHVDENVHGDVLQQFVDSANDYGIGYGFYYSVMKSFKLCRAFTGENSCMETILPGQLNVTDAEFEAIGKDMLEEIWTKYGKLVEIWVSKIRRVHFCEQNLTHFVVFCFFLRRRSIPNFLVGVLT
tara:strand:+ start:84 stop:830 length:747 start_codon:yes stop_codon:yes gene_type:complete